MADGPWLARLSCVRMAPGRVRRSEAGRRRPVAPAPGVCETPAPPWSAPPLRRFGWSRIETSRLHTSHAFETNTLWDETSQPLPAPSITSGVETSRLHTRPHNARHQFGTSPVLPQPVSKTLKGFQTVAGGKAARPPPPVPRPQNSSPLRLRRGLGVAASQSLRKPSVPVNRDPPRYHGGETKLTEGASPGRAESVRAEAQPGPAHFCVRLRGLRACAP